MEGMMLGVSFALVFVMWGGIMRGGGVGDYGLLIVDCGLRGFGYVFVVRSP